ncbi:MAG: ABC transporter ATP-binding protein [bacterium]|nr:ABC transporter ATP-binding protein [bacterium]
MSSRAANRGHADLEEEVVASKAWDHSLFKRLLEYAIPHKVLFARCFAVLVGLFALELGGTWVWRHVLDGPITAAQGVADKAPYVRSLVLWIGIYLAMIAAMMVLRYFETSQLTRTGQAVIHDLRSRLFRHMQRLDLAFFDKQPTGSLVTRVTTDVEHLNEMFTSGVVVLFFDLLKVAVVLAALFWIDWELALVVTAMTPLLIGISIAFRGGARRAHRIVRARLARLNGYLQEVLSGIRVVQVFRREPRVSGLFEDHLDEYFQANQRTIFLFALFYPSMSLAVFAIQGVALWVGVTSITKSTLTYGQFFQFWLLLNMLVRPIRELGERYNVLQSAFASAERIFQVLDTRPTVRHPPIPEPLPESSTPPHVRFDDVSFSYVEGKQVLDGVSFEIPPGATVAVVGATGSGKSTLVNLLLRFYEQDAGRITMDGVDTSSLSPDELRGHFGLVLQEDFLFAGSVRDNLVMDRNEVDQESLEEALETSNAKMFLARLDGGLDAEVAERGATFSTGERQLLAIARALAGRPNIVVLDEATASVDSETEKKIEAATERLLTGRSALVVAHRLSTIRRANEILVMHKGRLHERGTHEELLRQGGLYARLYALQFADQDDAAAVG